MTAMALETKQRPWWVHLIAGILAVVVGGVLLWAPAKTAAATWVVLVQLLGIYWLVEGILDIVSMFVDHTAWGWKLFIGIVSILAGSYILMYPIAAAVALPQIMVLVLGIWGLIQGAVLLALAFKGGGLGAGVLGALGVFFGLVLIGNYYQPGWGLSLVWVSAIGALIGGIVLIYSAFQARPAAGAA